MKKLLMMTVLFAASSLCLDASSVDCTANWGVARTSGFSCVSGNEVFGNFSNALVGPTGFIVIPDDWELTIGELAPDEHYITFTGPSPSSTVGAIQQFGISYSIDLDSRVFPNKPLTSISVTSTMNLGSDASPIRIAQKSVFDATGALLGAATTSGGSVDIPIVSSQAVLIQELFTFQNGALSTFRDKMTKASANPEPETYIMMALGLSVLGLLARRKPASVRSDN